MDHCLLKGCSLIEGVFKVGGLLMECGLFNEFNINSNINIARSTASKQLTINLYILPLLVENHTRRIDIDLHSNHEVSGAFITTRSV